MNQIIKFETSTGKVELTSQTVKTFLVHGDADKVTDQEVTLFMELCKYRKLNPFLNEAYLIKFGTYPATMAVSYDVYKQRADNNPKCKGYTDGVIILTKNEELKYREGALKLPGETLVGGWCEVIREDYTKPVRVEVTLEEYQQLNSKGELNKNWREKPAFMIDKVALAQGLRKAFPNDFSGLYMEEENTPITKAAEENPVDGELITTFTKDEVMQLVADINQIAGDKEKGKALLCQTLAELGLRDADAKYQDLKISEIESKKRDEIINKATEIKNRN